MKKVLIIGILSLSILASCGSSSKAGIKESSDAFKLINFSQLNVGRIREYRHTKTGCHYIIMTGDGKAVVQMMDKNGKPYCD